MKKYLFIAAAIACVFTVYPDSTPVTGPKGSAGTNLDAGEGYQVELLSGQVEYNGKRYQMRDSIKVYPADIIAFQGATNVIDITVKGKKYQFVESKAVTMRVSHMIAIIVSSAKKAEDKARSELIKIVAIVFGMLLGLALVIAAIVIVYRTVQQKIQKRKDREYEKKLKPMVLSSELKDKFMGKYKK
ncbi:MAG: hypothetical protein HZC28_09140 [Spirochaetes bacterium]|nr:hypothetical protein [Spirochaetota bacterium]